MGRTIFPDVAADILERIILHLHHDSPHHRPGHFQTEVPEHCMISDAERYAPQVYRDLLNLSLTCKQMRRTLGPRIFGHVSVVRTFEWNGRHGLEPSIVENTPISYPIEELEPVAFHLTDRVRRLLAARSLISFNNYVECLEADTLFVALITISAVFPRLRALRIVEFQPAYRGASNDLIPKLEYLCASVADITRNPVLYNSLQSLTRLDVLLDKPEAGTFSDFVSQLKHVTDINIYIPEHVHDVEHIQFRLFLESIPPSVVYLALRTDLVMMEPQLKSFINLVNNVWINLEQLKLPHQTLLAMSAICDDHRPVSEVMSRNRLTSLSLTLSRRYDKFRFNHGCVAWFAMITATTFIRIDFELTSTLSWPRNCDTLQILLTYLSLMCNYKGVILALLGCIWSRSDERLLAQFVDKETRLLQTSTPHQTIGPRVPDSLRNLHLWSRLPFNDPDYMREEYYAIGYARPDLQEFFRQWRSFLDGPAFTAHDTLQFLIGGAAELMAKQGDFAVWDIVTSSGNSARSASIDIAEVEFLSTLWSLGYRKSMLDKSKGLKKRLKKFWGR